MTSYYGFKFTQLELATSFNHIMKISEKKEKRGHVLWAKSGSQDDLMLTPTNIEDPPSQCAVCAVVGTLSTNRIFLELEAHGNYNPNFERTSLRVARNFKSTISDRLTRQPSRI